MPYWTRERAAAFITAEHFEISVRQLARWHEVPLVYLNSRAHGLDSDWRRAAQARLKAMLASQDPESVSVLRLAKLGNKAVAAKRAAMKSVP
jgi:hypothetical protein